MIYFDPQKTVDLFANALKNIEELAYQYDKAVVLSNFPRCLQLDAWTCGARAAFAIMRYFGKRCTVKSVEKELRTDWEGTNPGAIKTILTKHGLRVQEKRRCAVSDLAAAIDDGYPVLISTHDSWHYEVVYGYSEHHIFVANSAILGECGSLWCRVPKKEFSRFFDRWGLVVSDK